MWLAAVPTAPHGWQTEMSAVLLHCTTWLANRDVCCPAALHHMAGKQILYSCCAQRPTQAAHLQVGG